METRTTAVGEEDTQDVCRGMLAILHPLVESRGKAGQNPLSPAGAPAGVHGRRARVPMTTEGDRI
jgi:hypothetical protein